MKLQIEKMIYGGSGLAHTPEGRAVFVPYTLPGELVEVECDQDRNVLNVYPGMLLKASPDRIEPGCAHFGACGGCQYQHASYTAQLRIKQQILIETLTRIGLVQLPPVTQHLSEPWHYRNRIRLRVNGDAKHLRMGYTRRASSEFLPIHECPIAAPILWHAGKAILALAAKDASVARWLDATAEIEFACTNDESRLEMTLLLHTERRAGFAELCERVRERLPELVGASAAMRDVRRSREPVPLIDWGAAGLPMVAGERQYWVTRGGFFQVNRTLVDKLVRIVVSDHCGELAWDLFAGVGLFTRALRERFGEIVAVEASRAAASDLDRARIGGIRTVASPVLEFLRRAAIERDRPQLIVLDPPRAGVGVEGARLIAAMRAAEIVYVSCDPATLARDLRVMVDSGYDLAELHLVDLFPQTFHLETVAVLQRA